MTRSNREQPHAMRGIVYVSKTQCAKLREEIGFTEQEAARRAKITVPQLREALPVVNWRGTGAIPLATVQAVIKRLQSNPGYTVAEAAKLIGQDAAWAEDRIQDGTVRPLRTRLDHEGAGACNARQVTFDQSNSGALDGNLRACAHGNADAGFGCEIARNTDPLRAVFASNPDPSALCVSIPPFGRIRPRRGMGDDVRGRNRRYSARLSRAAPAD